MHSYNLKDNVTARISICQFLKLIIFFEVLILLNKQVKQTLLKFILFLQDMEFC